MQGIDGWRGGVEVFRYVSCSHEMEKWQIWLKVECTGNLQRK